MSEKTREQVEEFLEEIDRNPSVELILVKPDFLHRIENYFKPEMKITNSMDITVMGIDIEECEHIIGDYTMLESDPRNEGSFVPKTIAGNLP